MGSNKDEMEGVMFESRRNAKSARRNMALYTGAKYKESQARIRVERVGMVRMAI